VAKKAAAYVSPVQPLPALAAAGGEDWASF